MSSPLMKRGSKHAVPKPSQSCMQSLFNLHQWIEEQSTQTCANSINQWGRLLLDLVQKYLVINGFPMWVFKWSIDFHVDRESSLVPVWFALRKLPVHLFHKVCLLLIVACLGWPLCVDATTALGLRPIVAWMCIEVDLLNELLVGLGSLLVIGFVSGKR